jgi:hypothetical protein
VQLSEADATLSAVSAFKQFPEELFPPTIAATSGLDTLLLDHAPHWEPAKRRAFLDWLRAGGKVHLLSGADGRYPVFSDELSVLNSPLERARVGAGLVVRHAVKAHDIKISEVQADEIPLREYKPGESPEPTQTTEAFLRTLAQMNQRRYDWEFIYVLAIAYAVLVGPANLRAGRRLADYRLRIALLLGTIAGFAWLFNVVGHRGQGEANVINSLAYARAIDGDTYDVMQWVNVFAARGAHYTITHDAPHNLYATGQDYEPVNGVIESGKAGRFVVDIPMFSRRAFLHEAEMKGANIPLKIVSWDVGKTLQHLVLNVGPDFRKQILDGWVVLGDEIYPMKFSNDGLEFRDADKQPLESIVSASNLQQLGYAYGSPQGNAATNVEGQFRKCVKPLIIWSLGREDFKHANASSSKASEQVQLFLFAQSPKSFSITGSELGHEVGYVLYHFDLFKPGTGGKYD